MTDFILTHEASIRLGVFVSILLLMMSAEALFPRKTRVMGRAHRWTSNLLLIVIDGLFVRLLFPIVAVGVAIIAADKNWGFFNIFDLPIWLEIILAIIILDMMIYWQHVASHHIPFLWAMHKVHHADRDIDAAQPSEGHDGMVIGLKEYQNAGPASLTWSLLLPLGKGLKTVRNWL